MNSIDSKLGKSQSIVKPFEPDLGGDFEGDLMFMKQHIELLALAADGIRFRCEAQMIIDVESAHALDYGLTELATRFRDLEARFKPEK